MGSEAKIAHSWDYVVKNDKNQKGKIEKAGTAQRNSETSNGPQVGTGQNRDGHR